MTTDVQGVSLCQHSETSFSIMCIFLTGSSALECFYTLVSTSNDGSVSGRVERGNSSEGAADLSAYDEVILMDWEGDGTNGTTPVRLDLNFTTCPTTEGKSSYAMYMYPVSILFKTLRLYEEIMCLQYSCLISWWYPHFLSIRQSTRRRRRRRRIQRGSRRCTSHSHTSGPRVGASDRCLPALVQERYILCLYVQTVFLFVCMYVRV